MEALEHEISITEVGSFLDCRRKWYLSSQYIHNDAPDKKHRGIERAGMPESAFWFGTLIHSALETFYKCTKDGKSFDDSVAAANEKFEAEVVRIEIEIQKTPLLNWADYEYEFLETISMGREMITNYFLREKTDPIAKEILVVEERYRKKIRASNGDTVELTGRFDLVGKDRHGFVWLIDHKSASQKPWLDGVEIDAQLTGYCFLYYCAHGVIPRGAIYNVLLKQRLLHKTLADGISLSQDKSQKTTFSHYLADLTARKLPLAKYEKFLNDLKSRGWTDFFLREGSPRSETELVNYENRMLSIVDDVADAMRDPSKRYPNPGQFKCRGCQFVRLCKSYETGEDVDEMIRLEYRPREPRE